MPCWIPKFNIYRLNITSKTQKQNHPIAQRCKYRLYLATLAAVFLSFWLRQLQPPNDRQASFCFPQQMAVRSSTGPTTTQHVHNESQPNWYMEGRSCWTIGIAWLLLRNAWDWYVYEETPTSSNKWVFKLKSRPDQDGYVITTWLSKQKVSRPQTGNSLANTKDVCCKYKINLWTKILFFLIRWKPVRYCRVKTS